MLRSSGHTVSRTRDIKMSFSRNKKWKKCILLAQEILKCSQKDFFAEHRMNNEGERREWKDEGGERAINE